MERIWDEEKGCGRKGTEGKGKKEREMIKRGNGRGRQGGIEFCPIDEILDTPLRRSTASDSEKATTRECHYTLISLQFT